MFKSKCLVLLFCYVALGSAASVSFIEKCTRTDKECIVRSAQKALPFFAAGVPSIGLPSSDPMTVKSATFKEAGLTLTFNDAVVTNLAKCKIVTISREVETELQIDLDCPVTVRGTYTTSGKLMNIAPVEGSGPFLVQMDNLVVNARLGLSYVDGADGKKYWDIDMKEKKYDSKSKTVLKFENLFNGDEEKAKPVNDILSQNAKELIKTAGDPLVSAVIDQIFNNIKYLFSKVSADQLEQ